MLKVGSRIIDQRCCAWWSLRCHTGSACESVRQPTPARELTATATPDPTDHINIGTHFHGYAYAGTDGHAYTGADRDFNAGPNGYCRAGTDRDLNARANRYPYA